MTTLKDNKQLPLGLGLRDDCTLETFYPGDNSQALKQIKKLARGVDERFVFVWGRQGVGKTHLLQGACHWANRYNRRAVYLSLGEMLPSSNSLEGFEHLDLVCLDDVEKIATNEAWEEAIFHLFNRVRHANQSLLIAADCAPAGLNLKLADLQSRLMWGVTYPLQPLNDEQLLLALQLRADQRGLVLSPEVGLFLIRRCTRSMPELYQQLDNLDKASLAAQRRLTIPFIKTVLSL